MRVLVVEDEKSVASGLQRGLAEDGFAVDVVRDGEAALTEAFNHDYALIILDILLPKLNGFQVCRRLRQEGVSVPILMLTAKAGEFDEAEGLDTGADDYLRKPFSMVVLLARVQALLRRGHHAGLPAMRAGELLLDPVRHECWRGEEKIALTPREVAVLAHLVDLADEVVPKAELLDAVWGSDFEGDPNIVEVYIRHLRRKLDDLFDTGMIETVRGAGYRLTTKGQE
jgi:DNA-binding response OmpR family regulator